jgi:hydrogenase maturation protein HypF
VTVRSARSLHVTGVVQGVGYRPFVYGLAHRLGITGWVNNASDGVWCLAEGPATALDALERALAEEAPLMAVVTAVIAEGVELGGHDAFSIVASRAEEGAMTLVSPDIATCDACRAELRDPTDRRRRYPFINCTNCGPRFTIIEDVPYDRPMTTMRDFPLCPECAAEYADPADRRFHAQPDACFVCGPRLYLNADGAAEDWRWSPDVEVVPRPHRELSVERGRSDAIIAAVADLLRNGRIVAVKGLGGFQLACDATNETAVSRLRERKRRWGKPLAVMVRSIDEARAICEVSDDESRLLASPAAPIVLLRMRGVRGDGEDGGALAPSIAPRLRECGVMLAYTPLHHLLLEAAGQPLVMTSGNLSEEPIATGNAEALNRLSAIADAFLLHDRDICARYDDSVTRVGPTGVEFIRRARGYAPFPLELPFNSDADIVALGPEQKNTVTLVRGSHAFVSQHIGDMENAETFAAFEHTIEAFSTLFRIEPKIVAHDLHPEYLATKHAPSLGLPMVGVQHHHAHIVSVMAEHAERGPVIGVALDGTGYGPDGTIWGGEVLLATWESFERVGHLAYLPMPGGAAAIRRPARMALGALAVAGQLEHAGAAPLRERLKPGEETTLLRMIERGINTPLTSSAGRLFDAVAALAGVRDDARYEGQAAIELEALADAAEPGSYAFAIVEPELDRPFVIDSRPVLTAILDDVASGAPAPVISARFHRAVAQAIVDGCVRASAATGIETVALAGGVFMNRLVLGGAVTGLAAAGLRPITHRRLPANDGGVSFGQAVVAWARRHEL